MKKIKINPIDLINDHFSDLQEKFKLTSDPQQKYVLYKRLRNLRGVMQFLDTAQADKAINHSNSLDRAA